jgi:hypothetical protein
LLDDAVTGIQNVKIKTSIDGDLTTDLMRAQARLGLIARMAKLNLQETPDEQDFAEVLRNILAACGLEDEPRGSTH